MITAVDTNVFIALWDDSDSLNIRAQNALDRAYAKGGLVISGAVFVELVAAPERSIATVETFLYDTGIEIDWRSSERIWRTTGKAFQGYIRRRRKQRQMEPRRLVTDFFIGAHALENKHALLTLDNRIFKTAFPTLQVLSS